MFVPVVECFAFKFYANFRADLSVLYICDYVFVLPDKENYCKKFSFSKFYSLLVSYGGIYNFTLSIKSKR